MWCKYLAYDTSLEDNDLSLEASAHVEIIVDHLIKQKRSKLQALCAKHNR